MPATPIAIVAGKPADIPLVQRLADEVWRRHYPGIISDEQIEYMLARGYTHDALLRFVTEPGAGLALAWWSVQVAGFVAWYKQDTGTMMKLDKLYVLAAHQGEGIGRALIEHVVTLARATGCAAVTLNVNRGNVRAIGAYERCGFAIRERGDFPIGNGFVMEDFVMVREV